VTVGAILVLSAASLGSDWAYSAQTHSGRTQLMQAFDQAKALALRNPGGFVQITGAAGGLPTGPAAGMKVTFDGQTTTVLVCTGSATDTRCVPGGTVVTWITRYFGPVTTTINNLTATASSPVTVDFDNRGTPQLGTVATSVAYKISRGGSQNDETGTFY
jgi:hypothetical protein